jgi:hypothetical protein
MISGSKGKGLTVADVCPKLGINQNAYHRGRQRHDPAEIDEARRIRDFRRIGAIQTEQAAAVGVDEQQP